MKYDVRMSTRFKKDMKLVQKRGYDQRLIFEVIELLANGMKLDEKYKDHLLTGDYGGSVSAISRLIGCWCTSTGSRSFCCCCPELEPTATCSELWSRRR